MNTFEDIRLQPVLLGCDHLLVISGGEAHIGAASTAFYKDGEVQVETVSVPGHKENVLTHGMAKQAAEELKATVTVVMGIHYDGLKREEIEQISSIALELLQQYLKEQKG